MKIGTAAILSLALALAGLFGDEDEPSWLAQVLASTDADVDASIEAYEQGDYEVAQERLDAAIARRGERSELHYNRGLISLAMDDAEAARAAFQQGTLSKDPQVQASSFYELGNLAMDREDWDDAIAQYIECLTVQPEHHNAKWNLELALQRKQDQQEQDQQDQDQQEQDQQEQDQQEQDQQEQDQQGEGEQDQQEQDQQGEGEQDQQEQQGEDPGKQDQQGEGEQHSQDQQQQGQPDQQQQGQQGEPQQDEQQQGQREPEQRGQGGEQVQAQPIEGGDLDAALEELDRQDAFMFGRGRGSNKKVEKDW